LPRIAVLGAGGFLGMPIVKALTAQGWEVIAFSRTFTPNSLLQEIQVDLFDELSLKSALNITHPEIVLSTAWDTEHGKFWTNKLNTLYRDASLKFAELSFQAGVETFIGLGTMSEYGMSPGSCDAKFSPLVSTDLYSKSKIETGLELERIGEKFGRRTHWARIFQAFGPNEKPERFVPSLIESLRRGENFSIRTPDFEMDWIHSSEIASAIVFTLENKMNHFVDIGTGIATSVRALSELICEELGLDRTLLDFSEQIPGHEKRAVVGSDSQLLSLGWQPTESLRNRIGSLR
jgi:nucleoside-diphosphate-sugar epimerase